MKYEPDVKNLFAWCNAILADSHTWLNRDTKMRIIDYYRREIKYAWESNGRASSETRHFIEAIKRLNIRWTHGGTGRVDKDGKVFTSDWCNAPRKREEQADG
jgi:hypothetical protein